jgi:GR25 family glycosyltransferase involved in LPS biosynthesis
MVGLGAAGCILAHHDVWSYIADQPGKRNRIFLILEDDARITRFGLRNLEKIFQTCAESQFDLVHLGNLSDLLDSNYWLNSGPFWRKKKMSSKIRSFKESAFLFLNQLKLGFFPAEIVPGFPWRAHAYVMSKRLAESLNSEQPSFDKPIDQVLKEVRVRQAHIPNLRVGKVLQTVFSYSGRESLIEALGR